MLAFSEPPTPDFIQSHLDNLPPRVKAIFRDVENEMHIPCRDLVAWKRTKPIYRARQEAMRRCRKLENPKPSFPRIGRWFLRDHTTVMHAVNPR
jgi:chromosomal replication initiation ATPase DnaA